MPLGIAAGSRDELYVADRQTRKIQKLSPEGKVMGSFGSQSNKVGGLNHPESIAVATDRLFVVDTGNHCVQVSQKLFFSLNSLILLILYVLDKSWPIIKRDTQGRVAPEGEWFISYTYRIWA